MFDTYISTLCLLLILLQLSVQFITNVRIKIISSDMIVPQHVVSQPIPCALDCSSCANQIDSESELYTYAIFLFVFLIERNLKIMKNINLQRFHILLSS